MTDRLSSVPAAEWNALPGINPCTRHEFLSALEVTDCAGARTGWHPHHLLVYRGKRLTGALPLYAKTHSRGEYVFDYAWAHAFEQHGLPYYPKLVSCVPFTPVPGVRLLAADPDDKAVLAHAATRLARDNRLSSVHVLFPDEDDRSVLTQAGFALRQTVQFHWLNSGYGTMDDFVAALNQKNRKKVRQSRRHLADQGVRFEWLEGPAIGPQVLDFFYACYRKTYLEHGHQPYLNHEFFAQLRRTIPDQILIVLARQRDEAIAAAFFLRDDQHLYGRYWGSMAFVSGLHFETCYLQGIEYAIANGLKTFEGGAQGEHKLARGLMPVSTWSAHWIADERYARAIADFVTRESAAVDDYVDVLKDHSPFRRAE